MKVVGLDLSLLATGLCILSGDDAEPLMSTLILRRVNTKTVSESIGRLISISDEILGIVSREAPDAVVIEAPAMNQQWQAAAIGELHGVVKTNIYRELGIVPMVQQATKLRRVVVGKIEKTFEIVTDSKGKQKKRVSYGNIPGKRGGTKRATIKDVIESILKERGLSFPTQDEMDAYICARWFWDTEVTGKIAPSGGKKGNE